MGVAEMAGWMAAEAGLGLVFSGAGWWFKGASVTGSGGGTIAWFAFVCFLTLLSPQRQSNGTTTRNPQARQDGIPEYVKKLNRPRNPEKSLNLFVQSQFSCHSVQH
jgi:hypothetical protein